MLICDHKVILETQWTFPEIQVIVSKTAELINFFFYMFYFQHLETVIKSRIPGLQSLINKTIIELETELNRIGKPIAADTGVSHFFPSPLSPFCIKM